MNRSQNPRSGDDEERSRDRDAPVSKEDWFREAEAESRRGLDDPTRRWRSLTALAILYFGTGHLVEAAETAETMIAEGSNPNDRALGYATRGSVALLARDYQKGILFLEEGLRQDCSNKGTLVMLLSDLACCQNRLGRHTEAEATARRGLALDDAKLELHGRLGVSLVGQGRPLEAARHFLRTIEINPKDLRGVKELRRIHRDHPGVLESDAELWAEVRLWLEERSEDPSAASHPSHSRFRVV